MNWKKINFKQQKYILPLIALPFLIIIGSQLVKFFEEKEENPIVKEELSTGLGEVQDSILTKNDAYDAFYKNRDNRSLLGGLSEEQDSLNYYEEGLSNREKRYIDSLNYVNNLKNEKRGGFNSNESYYKPPQENNRRSEDSDYERSADIIRMLNNEASGGNGGGYSKSNSREYEEKEEEQNPVKMLRQQMLLMDSIEKAKDPEYQAKLEAERKLKRNRAKMEAFLNSTLKVSKAGLNSNFNSITKYKDDKFIKAIIDENIDKGYLGSRIRFRLLEDINVGKHRIAKGTLLYGQISGFETQRVKLNIISILNNGEILPINLSIYDVDGMQGLYVPQSTFREMMRELGSNSIQGTNMDRSGESFFTSFLSRAFQSTSRTIANLIRTNKTKLKYNSYVYLINEQQLNNNNYEQ